ncbi:DNA/RNA non-specific endonuclease [Streptomyces sp. NPDC002870]|uniref:DNA/RNA non-specific endonuclease n=1 Tax=Streptomyces sp. NPDC002870 TaxID=3364666 RepID=UPI0036B95861
MVSRTGHPVYKNNPLDKGHLVRRLDPVWGTGREAETANSDTFHCTNAAPQKNGHLQPGQRALAGTGELLARPC